MPYKLKKLLAKAQPVAHLECRRVEGKLCCKNYDASKETQENSLGTNTQRRENGAILKREVFFLENGFLV